MAVRDHTYQPRQLIFLIVGVVGAVELIGAVLFRYVIELPPWSEITLEIFFSVMILYPLVKRVLLEPLEKDLRKHVDTEDRLRVQSLALESAENTVFITDPDGVITWVNPAFTRLTGFSPDEAIGNTPRILKSGKQHEDYYVRFWKEILAGNAFSSEVINKRKDGTLFTVDQIVTPVKDERGRVMHFVAIQHDISIRKKYEEQLFHQKAMYESMLAGIGEGVVAVDNDGIITFINSKAVQILNLGTPDVIGKKYSEVWTVEDEDGNAIPTQNRILSMTLATAKILHTTLSSAHYFVHDHHRVLALETSSPIFMNGTMMGAVAVFHDVTKEKEIDRAKTEFVSLASHQLRTPLTTIGWYTEMLLTGDAGPITETQKTYLNEIFSGNKRMVELVNSLLNVSRIEMGTYGIEPELLDIKETIDGILSDLSVSIQQKKLRIEALYGDTGTIMADRKLIRMIFENLLGNAVRYTPTNGSITFTAKKDEGNYLFTVHDTGIGIPDADKSRVFTKLFRSENARITAPDGTGLGLYMVRSIIHAAGGAIWFESEEGKGTTFYVTIPAGGMRQKPGTKSIT